MSKLVGFETYGCYKLTVNESETITNAKPVCGGPLRRAHKTLERS
jgi:hypothetical protein